MNAVTPAQLDRFGSIIERRVGLSFDAAREESLASTLLRHARARGIDVAGFLDVLERCPASGDELAALAQDLTVGETYFFRNLEQFDALAEVALPARIAACGRGRGLRILSAGCSTGEEPYTIAMLLADTHAAGSLRWRPEILGVDLDAAALSRARRGRYNPWSLRATPPRARRWFKSTGREHQLDDRIRAAVTFETHNLADPDAPLLADARYDIVFCRNVLMYLTPSVAAAVLSRIVAALVPGGYLFLGHAESLRGGSAALTVCDTHGTFYYVRAGSPPTPVPGPRRTSAVVPARRIASPVVRPSVPGADERTAAIGEALALLERERYTDALAVVDALPRSGPDTELQLLRAVLLTHAGHLDDAESACGSLLAADSQSAGAHHLLALCSERRGDLVAAVRHDEVAIRLDPGFAMPRLHRGLMARRQGDREHARRELGLALALLPREDASRLRLFAGGFERAALVSLCRVELGACGGTG